MGTETAGDDRGNGGVAIATGTPDEWSDDIAQIGDAIANLTLSDATQLGKYLEDVHGIKPAELSFSYEGQAPPRTEEKEPEKTEFAVILEGVPDPTKKIAVIKVWREITNQGLKESKEAVENTPRAIKESCNKEEAISIKGSIGGCRGESYHQVKE